ncbi:MAG: DUF1761 domain-containing protein [Thermoplasmatota archaeon]
MNPASFTFDGFNWLGFILAIVANIAIGFVWYAPWFPTGRAWIKITKMDMSQKPPAAKMVMSMLLMLVGAILLMFVFAHNFMVYQDAYRNTQSGGTAGYKLTVGDGIMGGAFTWLGFIVPLNLNSVAFDNKPWSLFFINAGYYLVSLLVAGILLATVGT